MKTIKPDELFQNLGDFLKVKGIEFKGGDYAQRIRRGCNLLTDVVNTTQKTVKRAKVEADKKLDQFRQSIHEATAPKPSPAPSPRKPGQKAPRSKYKQPSTRAKARHRK